MPRPGRAVIVCRLWALTAVALLAAFPATSGDRVTGLDTMLAGAAPVAIAAEPVEITVTRQDGSTLRGAWILTADNPAFGGFSGLLIEDGRLLAVTDDAHLLAAGLALTGSQLVLSQSRLAPLLDPSGRRYLTKAGSDAEGLAWFDGRLAVAFERDHRIMLLGADGRLHDTIQPRSFEQLASNGGIEGLATLPDGRLLAVAEAGDAAGVPVFVIGPDGAVAEGRLALPGPHAVTGADVGPDGQLYVVLRDFSLLAGPSIRVMRFSLGPDGFPVADSRATLAEFESRDGIDNMEGIALDRSPEGALRLWLIADDNFSFLQRTLLLALDLPD
jgi:hypothetical protein